jgi:NAD(P)-dependent dehydrogenase (short-subunit alcohol dehydrogenase family)
MSSPANANERLANNVFARYPSLVDRTVLITGGATGIGASFVEHFAAQGARVAFFDIDATAGEALADELGDSKHKPLFLPCDLTDIDALQKAIADVKAALGPIQVLLNNAANDKRHTIGEVTRESFDAGIAVNIRHQFFAAQAVMEDMKAAQSGSIINLGSISWMLKNGGYPVYVMSKSAVQGLTRGLARDLGHFNIRVNTLVPGWVMTEKQKRLWLDDAGRRSIKEGQCIDAELEPADLARMALFLAADDSRMITAQDIVVDGGWACRRAWTCVLLRTRRARRFSSTASARWARARRGARQPAASTGPISKARACGATIRATAAACRGRCPSASLPSRCAPIRITCCSASRRGSRSSISRPARRAISSMSSLVGTRA